MRDQPRESLKGAQGSVKICGSLTISPVTAESILPSLRTLIHRRIKSSQFPPPRRRFINVHSRRPAMVDMMGGEPAVAKPPNKVTGHNGISLIQEASAKRRKVRKGTRSCWECKRRKIRCIFASPNDATCLGCQRRRATCVSQDMPEELSPPKTGNRHLSLRIARVEDFMKDFLDGKDVDTISHAEKELRKDKHSKFDPSTARSDDSAPSTIRAPPIYAEVCEPLIH